MAYTPEVRQAARSLYLKSWTPKDIATELKLSNERIVYYWADKYGWRDMLREYTVEDAITHQILALLEIEEPSKAQLDKLDRLIAHDVKLKKMRIDNEKKQERQANSSSNNGKSSNNKRSDSGTRNDEGNKGGKKKAGNKKNDVSHLEAEDFNDMIASLFDYQRLMRDVKNDPTMPRIRNVLKSRQIGFTYGCSAEAFEDAVLTGENQIFISATRAQAEVFRTYIIKIAAEFFDINLSGNPIALNTSKGRCELCFLATSASSAQSRPGNVYVDEYFWIRDFTRVSNVVSACATQERFRKTYFSTPSTKNHPAYPFWTGDRWRGEKDSRKNIVFPSDKEMKKGVVCPDSQWRYKIDVYDAVKGGCHLINPALLEEENSPDAFRNLYQCEFVDDSQSIFKLSAVEKLMTNCEHWTDFDPKAGRPFENREVWIGYDPSRTRDNACLVVLAPPATEKEKFRVLEKHYWKNLNVQHHMAEIKKIFARYNVAYFGMDTTGIGLTLWDLVSLEYPRQARAIHYSNDTKNRLVTKMIEVVESKRLQFDAEQRDIASAFMAIKRAMTGSGNMMTFKADRSDLVGHADVFWAIAHAVIHEPFDYNNQRKSTWSTS